MTKGRFIVLQEKYLSVRIDDEGNLKRIFHTDSSAEKLPDTTAVDEVLDFAGIMLQRFLSNAELTDYFQNQYIKNKELEHCVDFDAFNHAVQLVNDYWTRIDICPGFIASDEFKTAILNIASLHFSINKFLYRINENTDMELDDSFSFLGNFDCNIKYSYNDKKNSIEREYRFQYPDDYYKFLLMHFVRLKPNISRCRLCGRYFKAKTKKKNKYCGNTLGDGVTTCRVFAPKLFSKSDIEILFEKVNQRMYKRYERALSLEKKPSAKDLTYTQYCDWHNKAIKARNDCIDGIISFEQASKIIDVE